MSFARIFGIIPTLQCFFTSQYFQLLSVHKIVKKRCFSAYYQGVLNLFSHKSIFGAKNLVTTKNIINFLITKAL